jgi:hypothetical protein
MLAPDPLIQIVQPTKVTVKIPMSMPDEPKLPKIPKLKESKGKPRKDQR